MELIKPIKPQVGVKNYLDLIAEIEKGAIRIPRFQRDFVWNIKETAKLLDSILKGYPIGTFTLWRTDKPMKAIREIGGEKIPEPSDGEPIEYVLDGQQRITSIYAAHKGLEISRNGGPKTDYKKIYVNLKHSLDSDEDIITHEKPDGFVVTVHDVLNYELGSIEEIEREDEAKVSRYNKFFENYDFSTILLKRDHIAAAIETFTRINTRGQKLSLFEIMCAMTYDEVEDFDMEKEWDKFMEQAAKIKYDSISNSVILNILALVLSDTTECTRKVTLELDKYKIIKTWVKATSALKDSIDYFRGHFRIPNSRLLPYDTLLVPFAYFFYKNGTNMNLQQKEDLDEFFWRASLSHRYSSSSENKLSRDIKGIVEKTLKNKEADYGEMNVPMSEKTLIGKEFNMKESFTKAILCLLAWKRPRDFNSDTDVIVDGSGLNPATVKNCHHFFPHKHLKEHKNVNSLMNITIISEGLNKRIGGQLPSEYIDKFSKENKKIGSSLDSHFIKLSGFGIKNNDYEEFLDARARMILEELKNRIRFKAEELQNAEKKEKESKIKNLIEGGESNVLEFKSTLRFDMREKKVNKELEHYVMKTIAAFMNSKGGILLIGVSDGKELLGLDSDISTLKKKDNDGFLQKLSEVIENLIGAEFNSHIDFEIVDVDNFAVCVIEAQPIFEKSVFVKFNGKDNFFIRSGSSSKPLTREAQSNYEANRRLLHQSQEAQEIFMAEHAPDTSP